MISEEKFIGFRLPGVLLTLVLLCIASRSIAAPAVIVMVDTPIPLAKRQRITIIYYWTSLALLC